MNKKMSDAEKAARTVPPSVPQDQRQEVVDGATSRIESVEGGVNRDLLVKLLDEAGVERGYVGGERFREHVADYILPKLLSAVRALRAEAWDEGWAAGREDEYRWDKGYGYTKNPYLEADR